MHAADDSPHFDSIWSKRTLIAFNVLLLLAALVGCLATGNGEFVFYLVTLAVLMAGVGWVYGRVGFSDGVLWGLSVWAAAHMAGGLVPIPASWPHAGSTVLYSWWLVPEVLKYDNLVHSFGFGVTTFACFQGLVAASGLQGGGGPTLGVVFLAGSAACGLGAANEIVEFIATVLVPETNVGGYRNTALDLVANAIGATIAGGMLLIRRTE